MSKKYEILTDYVCNYIFPKKKYSGEYQIRIEREDTFKIIYKHHIYHVAILEKDGIYYWVLKPYFKSFYTTVIDRYNSFDRVLFAIREDNETRTKPKIA